MCWTPSECQMNPAAFLLDSVTVTITLQSLFSFPITCLSQYIHCTLHSHHVHSEPCCVKYVTNVFMHQITCLKSPASNQLHQITCTKSPLKYGSFHDASNSPHYTVYNYFTPSACSTHVVLKIFKLSALGFMNALCLAASCIHTVPSTTVPKYNSPQVQQSQVQQSPAQQSPVQQSTVQQSPSTTVPSITVPSATVPSTSPQYNSPQYNSPQYNSPQVQHSPVQ